MRQNASPLARKMAQDNKIDLSAISGSGPDGRIIKRDIEKARAQPQAPSLSSSPLPSPPPHSFPDPRLFYQKDDYVELPLTAMNRSIAKRLTHAKQEIPHFYLTMALPLDELLAMRRKANSALKDKKEAKLSVNDFIVRAAALALMEAPEVNVSFANEVILQHKHADIGVAVALPDGGLMTPIIPRAETLSLRQISSKIKELAELAAARRLKPSQYEGGSFSVSNLGMFGIEAFTAIINPPQAAILAVGAAKTHLARVDGNIIERTEMRVTLSCDHRAINGAVGAQFLRALKDYVIYPYLLSF